MVIRTGSGGSSDQRPPRSLRLVSSHSLRFRSRSAHPSLNAVIAASWESLRCSSILRLNSSLNRPGPLPIPEVFFQSAYLDSDRYVGLLMIKHSASLKGTPRGTVFSHLWLTSQPGSGCHPVRPPGIRRMARTKACGHGRSARCILIGKHADQTQFPCSTR